MGMFVTNKQISCNVCGRANVTGREQDVKIGNELIHECKWICPQCGNLIRRDSIPVSDMKNGR